MNCNGAISKNNKEEVIMILQGDHRQIISEKLQSKYQVKKSDIIMHGY